MFRTLSILTLVLVGISGCSSSRNGSVWPSNYPGSRTYPSTRSYPASARTTQGGQERYVICHNGRTRTLPAPAIDAHLRHGDSFGACGSRGRAGYDTRDGRATQGRSSDDRRDGDRREDQRRDDDRRDDDRAREGNGNGNGHGNGRGNGNRGNGRGRGNGR